MPNRLSAATSPYLRAHADNPVDWYPWGSEAFDEARRRDVPVLVSIGYSTCHWCHVMARESFSDDNTAAYLNEHFVSIKVDREEYPDVDASYLAAAGAFTGNLGWPLNVFVTPDGGPFFAGTYWPPSASRAQPAFREVLEAITAAWTNRRDEVVMSATELVRALSATRVTDGSGLVDDFSHALDVLEDYEDRQFGGFGGAPKFPVAPVLSFLLDRAELGDEAAGDLARRTLDAMAASDLRDGVDGGFFRYATRRDWREPHYERMLYDNALLLATYARAGRVDVAGGIARFLLTTLRVPGGAFASAQDSESIVDGERVEGTYYSLDGESRARQAAPAIDAKVLTGWNGLAIEALALAGQLLEHPEWIEAAATAADFLLTHHRKGVLARTSIGGVLSSAPATLEDYGMLASSLLQLAITTGEVRFAIAARDLVDDCLPDLAVPGGAEPLLAAQGLAIDADPSEGAYPSGLSSMASAALRLWLLTADEQYRSAAIAAMSSVGVLAGAQPLSFGAALGVMSALTADSVQLVVVSDQPSELRARAQEWRRPGSVALAVTTTQAEAFAAAGFALLAGKQAEAAYLCREFVCALPVHTVEELRLP